MKIRERITKPRVIALVISCVLPLLSAVLSVFPLFAGFRWLGFALPVMLAIPVITVVLLFAVILSKGSPVAKTVLTVIILIAFVFSFMFAYLFGTSEQVLRYEGEEARQRFAEEVHWKTLPGLEEVGEPEEIVYVDFWRADTALFTIETDVLICRYSQTEYEEQKALLEETYVFQKEPLVAHGYTCDPVVELNGYLFRVLKIKDADDYPKQMEFIAVNDETREVVYLSAHDDDLDYIKSLEDYLREDCGWRHIS